LTISSAMNLELGLRVPSPLLSPLRFLLSPISSYSLSKPPFKLSVFL
jgi:hypothetical protein